MVNKSMLYSFLNNYNILAFTFINLFCIYCFNLGYEYLCSEEKNKKLNTMFILVKINEQINYCKMSIIIFSSKIFYKIIYLWSYLQILYNKYNPYVLDNSIYFIKNGEIKKKILKYNECNKYISYVINSYNKNTITINDEDYDIIIFNDYKNKKNLIFKNMNELTTMENVVNYYINYTFFNFIVSFNGSEYNVILKNDKYNFLIEKNIIDKHFLLYYFKNIEKKIEFKNISVENFKYNLSFLDDSLNKINVDDNIKITFKKYDYNVE